MPWLAIDGVRPLSHGAERRGMRKSENMALIIATFCLAIQRRLLRLFDIV